MKEDYEIDLAKMTENASRELAHLARSRFLRGNRKGKRGWYWQGREAMEEEGFCASDGSTTG